MSKKYKIISEDLMKNLVDFLDEVQFDAAKYEGNNPEAMQKINFCTWAINELLSSYDGYIRFSDIDKNKKSPKKPSKKSRDQYVDETFMDWNLPEMSDKEYEKLVDQFDAFLRGWEKEYNKKKKKQGKSDDVIQERPYKPHVEDVMEYCDLDEVIEFLKDDPELTDNERFELYYDERERRKPKEKGLTYNQLLKKAGIKGYKDESKNKK